MIRPLLLAAMVTLAASGCTNRMETVGQATPGKARTYSTHVKPVTSSQKCLDCHTKENASAPEGLGTYSVDKLYRVDIRGMLQNEAKPHFTDEEIANVLAWITAGAPDDSKTF